MPRGTGGQRGLGIDIRASFNLKSRLPQVRQRIIDEANDRSKEVAEFLYDLLIEEMHYSEGGRLYPFDKRNWDSGVHEASRADGNSYPAVWYGDFMESLGITARPYERSFVYAIGSTSIIGQHLEFGTYKMKARPWLSNIEKVALDVANKVFFKKFDRM